MQEMPPFASGRPILCGIRNPQCQSSSTSGIHNANVSLQREYVSIMPMCNHQNGWLLSLEAASCVLFRKRPSMVSIVGNSNNEHGRCKQRTLGPNSLTFANYNGFRLCDTHPSNPPFTGHCRRYIRRQSGRAPRSKWINRIK